MKKDITKKNRGSLPIATKKAIKKTRQTKRGAKSKVTKQPDKKKRQSPVKDRLGRTVSNMELYQLT